MRVLTTEQDHQVPVSLSGLSKTPSFDVSFELTGHKKAFKEIDLLQLDFEIAKQKPRFNIFKLDKKALKCNVKKLFFEIRSKKKLN